MIHPKDLSQGAYFLWHTDKYWTRAWTLQEVVLAKRVFIVSGKCSVDLDGIYLRARIFVPHAEGQHGLLIRPPWDEDPTMWMACQLRHRELGGRVKLWELEHEYKGYKSSRAADQIYGLLGMVDKNADGTSPVENIHVDYDKPVADIWLDVLFESSPPWQHLQLRLINPLNKIVSQSSWWGELKPDFDTLLEYIGRSRTSERHMELACLTYEVSHALCALEEDLVPLGFRLDRFSIIYRKLISALKLDFELTMQQDAAMFGFIRRESWHKIEHEKPSGWNCAAHRCAGEKARGAVLNRRILAAESVADLDLPFGDGVLHLNRLLKACGKHSESCHGSIVFEIPSIGIRMLVETFDNHMYQSGHSASDRR